MNFSIVEFSTRLRFDSDSEPPFSLIRIVDCMVWPSWSWYCRSRPPCRNMAAVSHCRCLCRFGDGQNETQDVSNIEEPIKSWIWNTDYFKVINTELLQLLPVGRPVPRGHSTWKVADWTGPMAEPCWGRESQWHALHAHECRGNKKDTARPEAEQKGCRWSRSDPFRPVRKKWSFLEKSGYEVNCRFFVLNTSLLVWTLKIS